MIENKFVGWIEKIEEPGQYDQEIVITDTNDADPNKPKYPTVLTIRASIKNNSNAQYNGLAEGDKIEVTFFVTGRSGTSKAGNYYHINELRLARDGGVKIIEKVKRVQEPEEEPSANVDDLPF